jgi:hypothetical protein
MYHLHPNRNGSNPPSVAAKHAYEYSGGDNGIPATKKGVIGFAVEFFISILSPEVKTASGESIDIPIGAGNFFPNRDILVYVREGELEVFGCV